LQACLCQTKRYRIAGAIRTFLKEKHIPHNIKFSLIGAAVTDWLGMIGIWDHFDATSYSEEDPFVVVLLFVSATWGGGDLVSSKYSNSPK
jgi:hypothetical protein